MDAEHIQHLHLWNQLHENIKTYAIYFSNYLMLIRIDILSPVKGPYMLNYPMVIKMACLHIRCIVYEILRIINWWPFWVSQGQSQRHESKSRYHGFYILLIQTNCLSRTIFELYCLKILTFDFHKRCQSTDWPNRFMDLSS